MTRQVWLAVILQVLLVSLVLAAPEGIDIISNSTEIPTPQSAATQTTVGGSFTTLVLNATTQTSKWKAYVGNVSGRLALRDGSEASIYDWDLVTVTGEVYASRNASIDWSGIGCVQDGVVTEEQQQLGMGSGEIDSINKTFNDTVHASFYVGTTLVPNSNCRAIATYVNNNPQSPDESALFQEILLDDGQRMVYATLLENDAAGYNAEQFDFQMIVAENPTVTIPSTYYFWAELG